MYKFYATVSQMLQVANLNTRLYHMITKNGSVSTKFVFEIETNSSNAHPNYLIVKPKQSILLSSSISTYNLFNKLQKSFGLLSPFMCL